MLRNSLISKTVFMQDSHAQIVRILWQHFCFLFSARRQYHKGLGLSQNCRVSEQRLCLLILQISISADRDVPRFFESGDIFSTPILKKRQKNVRCIVEGFLKISRSFFWTKGENMSVCYMEGNFFALPPNLQKFCPL